METSYLYSGRLGDLRKVDAHGRLRDQHLSSDEFPVLDRQGTEVVVGSRLIVSDDPCQLLCLFEMVELSVSGRASLVLGG